MTLFIGPLSEKIGWFWFYIIGCGISIIGNKKKEDFCSSFSKLGVKIKIRKMCLFLFISFCFSQWCSI